MTTVRTVALVGAGGFGSLWDKALQQYGLEVVAVVDPVGEHRAAARDRYGLSDARVYDGLDFRYLAETTPDLVLDSAPPGQRHERMSAAVRAGAHVLAAKPAAESAVLAHKVAATAAEHGKLALVAMQKRYLRAFQDLFGLCRSGQLGRIGFAGGDVSVDGQFWQPGLSWRSRMALPSLRDGGSHHIDLLRLVVGDEVDSVVAASWNPQWSPFDGDADFAATLRFHGGATAHLTTRWSRRRGPLRHYFSGFVVEGDRGAAWVENGELRTDGAPTPCAERPPMMDLADLNARMMADVLADLVAGRSDNRLDLMDHARTLAVVEAIELSAVTGTAQDVRYVA